MSNLKKQVESILNSAENNVINEFFWSGFDPEISKYNSEEFTAFKFSLEESGIIVQFVDNYGGEDCGSEYWSVYSFSKDKEIRYIKFNGYYASYVGSTFEEWYFVKPVPKSGFDFVEAD